MQSEVDFSLSPLTTNRMRRKLLSIDAFRLIDRCLSKKCIENCTYPGMFKGNLTTEKFIL